MGKYCRLNSVCGYAGVNVNCGSEFTADLHRIEGELGRGSCFHRHSVIWAFRHQCEEKRRSLHPLTLSLCMLQRVLEIRCHLLQSDICLAALPSVASSGSWICCLDPYKLPFP